MPLAVASNIIAWEDWTSSDIFNEKNVNHLPQML